MKTLFKKLSRKRIFQTSLIAFVIFFGVRELLTTRVDLGYIPPPMFDSPISVPDLRTAPLTSLARLLNQNSGSLFLRVIWASGSPEGWNHSLTYNRLSHKITHKYTGHTNGGWVSRQISESKINAMASGKQAWTELEWSHD